MLAVDTLVDMPACFGESPHPQHKFVDKRKEALLGFNQCSFPGAYQFLMVE